MFHTMVTNKSFRICLDSLVIFSITICWTLATEFDEYRIVETQLGQIRGVRSVSFLNNEVYYSFKGIRYAKPPLGKLRFKVSVKNDNSYCVKNDNSSNAH